MSYKSKSLGRVEFKGRVVAQLYPKPREAVAGTPGHDFGIFKLYVTEISLKNSIPVEDEITIKIKNLYAPMPRGKEYAFTADKTIDDQGRIGYAVLKVNREVDLSKPDNLETFLRAIFLTKRQIRNIFDTLGDPYNVLETQDYKTLATVPGIGEHTAKNIIRRYNGNKNTADIKVELAPYNFTDRMLGILMETYGSSDRVIDIVKHHPYHLITGVRGIGFKRADEIAQIGGLDKKSPERIQGYIIYFLMDQADNGHSYINRSELIDNIYFELGGKNYITVEYEDGTTNIQKAFKGLCNKKKPMIIIDERDRVYLLSMWKMECEIAYHLMRLSSCNRVNNLNWKKDVAEIEEEQGFEFTPEQRDGIRIGVENAVCIITGAAGTGKSTLVRGILGALKEYDFAQTSLAGKAAARLQEVTGQTGMTIHRLLGYSQGEFTYNQTNPLPYDMIVLDEISLVGGDIFLDLLRAIPTGSKLIMLGDSNQLEAIGTLNLAHDLTDSPLIPSVNLTKVQRQKALSGIIVASTKVRNGKAICAPNDEGVVVRGELKDMVLDMSEDNFDSLDRAMEWYEKLYDGDVMDIQLMSPVRERGESSVRKLNQAAQEIVNPIKDGEYFHEMNGYEIHKNDKVMCIKNNYDTTDITGKLPNPIYNGWTGIVKEFDLKDEVVVIDFPLAINGLVVIDLKEASDILELGYASTVHKLQGSSAKKIIGVIDSYTVPSMLTRQLLYTLLTRAEDYCVLVGQSSVICRSISTDKVPYKRTFLPEMLEKHFKNIDIEKERRKSEQSEEKRVNEGVQETWCEPW